MDDWKQRSDDAIKGLDAFMKYLEDQNWENDSTLVETVFRRQDCRTDEYKYEPFFGIDTIFFSSELIHERYNYIKNSQQQKKFFP